MSESRMERLLSFAQKMYFDKIGTKFRPSSMKNFWDRIFIIFEKVVFKFPAFSSNYLKLYEKIVEGEINLSKVSSKDNLLVVGCGSLPATTALIAIKTKANVVAIDKDSNAIDAANRFINNLNIKNVKIENANGKNYSVKDFHVIFLLYGLKSQVEILEKYAEEMNDNARIIFRLPSDVDEEIKEKILVDFEIKDCRRSKTLGAVDSYLLIKKLR